jgi:CRP-like cAMP-binding protein
MMPQLSPCSRNLFLSALPEAEYNHLKPHLELLEMKLGTVVHEPNEPIRYVYFPENAIVSIVTYLEDGSNIETGLIGHEGIGGIGVILSDQVSPREATIQLAGRCLRMKAQAFKEAFQYGGELNRLALRVVVAFIGQASQNAACTNHHRIENRLARWLLMIHDRVEGDDLRITQEYIAQMLGVHRPSVTESAVKLQEKSLIKYARGRITVLDRDGLENASCECYRIIKDTYDKYLDA